MLLSTSLSLRSAGSFPRRAGLVWGFVAGTLAALAVLAFSTAAFGVQVDDIPTPRPEGWVSDLAGVLSDSDRAEIDRIGDALHTQSGGEIAVVTIPSLEGRSSRPFAVELFNHWGIGRAEEDDGVLLFVSMGDRKVEIVLGDGVDGPAEQAASDRVMAEVILDSGPATRREAWWPGSVPSPSRSTAPGSTCPPRSPWAG